MFNCEIMKISQDYSEHLAKNVGNLVHSHTQFHGKYMGENLAYVGGSFQKIPSGDVPTNMWYNEIKKYDFNNPSFSNEEYSSAWREMDSHDGWRSCGERGCG